MKDLIVSFLLILVSDIAWADSSAELDIGLPRQYTSEQVQAVLRSIDIPQLAREADKSVPGVLKEKVAFSFHVYGTSGDIVVRPEVHAPSGWRGDWQLKVFLGEYLGKRFPGSTHFRWVPSPEPAPIVVPRPS
jgi:hypothetical protein